MLLSRIGCLPAAVFVREYVLRELSEQIDALARDPGAAGATPTRKALSVTLDTAGASHGPGALLLSKCMSRRMAMPRDAVAKLV